MSSQGDIYACFDHDWPDAAGAGFEGTGGWLRLGSVPGGAEIEDPFWTAVRLQQTGGGKARGKVNVDFYADVLLDSPAFTRINTPDLAAAETYWLGLHPFAGTTRLFVSSARVRRFNPQRQFQRHPGLPAPPNSAVLGFRLRLGEDGRYFKVARA